MADALFPEEAFVEICPRSGAAINVTTDVDSFEESGFEREIEYRTFYHNSKVAIKKSQNDGELNVHVKVTRADWDQILWGGTGSDFTSGGEQTPYRVTFCVTKDTTATSASGALASGKDHYRKAYANCYMTSYNPSLEVDGMLEADVTFQVSATDDDADPNVRIQIGSEAYSALGSYTVAQKWDA